MDWDNIIDLLDFVGLGIDVLAGAAAGPIYPESEPTPKTTLQLFGYVFLSVVFLVVLVILCAVLLGL